MVEFTLSILISLFLIFWIFEMIMVMYTYSTISNAAKEGVRYAIVHGSNNTLGSGPGSSDAAADNVKAQVNTFAQISLHDISAMTVTVNYPDGSNAAGKRVDVTVSYPFIPYINVTWGLPTIYATASGRIAN
jgi:Flp pilus assembly protein TadG